MTTGAGAVLGGSEGHHEPERSTASRWRHALKPASWPKLLVPMALGQAMAVSATGRVSWVGLVLGVAFTVADGAFIVLLNDWADERVDRIKRQMFPTGCSPKTIPDGILGSAAVLRAGLVAGVAAAATAVVAPTFGGHAWTPWAGLLALLVFVAYSLPPLRLNYRGGGEVLEALGVGVLLPLVNAWLQGGPTWAPVYGFLVGHGCLAMASAMASGLSDERSDREGGKRTLTTRFGNRAVRRALQLALLLGAGAWIAAALHWSPGSMLSLLFVPSLVVLLHARSLDRVGRSAVTDAFPALASYKEVLHAAIWRGTLALVVVVLLARVLVPVVEGRA